MNNSTVNFTANVLMMGSLEICALSFNLIVGLPVNSYVIWLIVTGTEARIASEFFFLNLSVCEIGNCLNSFFSSLLNFPWFLSLSTLINFLMGLTITGRPLFQCLICAERYLAVVHPVTFLKYKPLRYRLICCIAVWFICLGSCLVCMFSFNLFMYIIYIWFYTVQFLILLSIQMFCCLAVLKALKQSGPGERGREKEEENHTKRRAFYLILITTVTTVIIYFPFTISGFLFILTQQYISELFSFGHISFVFGGFVQPVLYLHRVGNLSCFRSSHNQ